MKKLIGLVVVIVVIGAGIFYFFRSNTSTRNGGQVQSPATTKNSGKNVTPEITFLSNTEREADFTTNVPLKSVDLSNIRVYTKSASVNAAGQEDDFPKNYFSVKYDPKDLTIVITDISGEFGNDFGAFRTGCAACTHEIEFTNLETTTGVKIPKIQISIY